MAIRMHGHLLQQATSKFPKVSSCSWKAQLVWRNLFHLYVSSRVIVIFAQRIVPTTPPLLCIYNANEVDHSMGAGLLELLVITEKGCPLAVVRKWQFKDQDGSLSSKWARTNALVAIPLDCLRAAVVWAGGNKVAHVLHSSRIE